MADIRVRFVLKGEQVGDGVVLPQRYADLGMKLGLGWAYMVIGPRTLIPGWAMEGVFIALHGLVYSIEQGVGREDIGSPEEREGFLAPWVDILRNLLIYQGCDMLLEEL